MTRRLILRNGLSPGDIVMLTAAVRDLKRALGAAGAEEIACGMRERMWWEFPRLAASLPAL